MPRNKMIDPTATPTMKAHSSGAVSDDEWELVDTPLLEAFAIVCKHLTRYAKMRRMQAATKVGMTECRREAAASVIQRRAHFHAIRGTSVHATQPQTAHCHARMMPRRTRSARLLLRGGARF